MSVYEQTLIPDDMKKYCVQPHWDASALYRRTIPDERAISLPLPPRPYSKICLDYRTSAPFETPPEAPKDMLFPGASDKYPPERYIAKVDNESKLERLDRPLVRDFFPPDCPGVPVYVPKDNGSLFSQRFLVPPPAKPLNMTMAELEVPKVLYELKGYACREQELQFDQSQNKKIWFNATKQEKYDSHTGLGEQRYDYPNGQQASSTNLPSI
jgi:hypothetical protein